jgi:hypothetical protein
MNLSFSTMNLLHECPHNYLNKINKVPQPENPYFELGHQAHRIMQDHVSGVKENEYFNHIKKKFPVVEVVDFDPRCKFEVPFGEHIIFGFVDGLDKPMNENPTELLEGKFSSRPWGLGQYKDHPQRKIYGWAIRSLKYAFLITGKLRPEEWKTNRIKTARITFTQQDYDDAEKYINDALKIIREGTFTSDLLDGKCLDRRCYWGSNCMFK